MRILFSVFALFCFTSITFAQMGFNGGYYSQRLPDWEAAAFGARSNDNLLRTGYSIELDYRIASMTNYRVDIYPTLTYNAAQSSLDARKFELKQYEFSLKTNIYLLSLEADCDCPTFSREASILKKGFFVQIAPGISYFKSNLTEEAIISEGDGLTFKLGLGIGVDIGLSDFITITPIVKYNQYFKANWEGLQDSIAKLDTIEIPEGNDVTNINQFYAGLRFGIRFRK